MVIISSIRKAKTSKNYELNNSHIGDGFQAKPYGEVRFVMEKLEYDSQ